MLSKYKQTVAPTAYPVTLDEAKAHCSLEGIDDHDAYLWSLIEAAVTTVEARVSRQIMPATWTLSLEYLPHEIEVNKPPVSAVTSISYIDNDGVSQTVDSDDYQVDIASLDSPARIKPVYGVTGPTTKSGTYGAVTVTFTTGYTTVPKTIKHAILFLVAHWFLNREPASEVALSDVPSGLDMLLLLSDWGCY